MADTSREALLGSRLNSGSKVTTPVGDGDLAREQRQHLLSGTDRLDASSQRLRESQRLANETEALGASILTDLRGQREQIENSRNVLMEADTHVDKSIRTLRGMARRLATNRIITVGVIVLLIVIIVAVLLGKFLRR
ncbi:snare region anchored in the vesicle membrane C-terminus-domain-containing protein [Dipodascopsis tothii]|uniref:snare region anchored in the vesicle membrane C-terminus-domain-containing protein n=1 Tax=Dipodascopsis tothii TaxID=44089 RepID=UPI0034CFB3DD